MKYCLSDRTDGASAYHGEYGGLQKKISDVAEHHVHIWSYAHVHNLVVTGATCSCVNGVSFFNFLQKAATFIKVSYKRMAELIQVVERRIGENKMKRIKLIGETRWLGKSNATRAIFGRYDSPDYEAFVDL